MTTLVMGIAQALGIEEEVTKPSFTIISEYEGSLPLYHMDLVPHQKYQRVRGISEAMKCWAERESA